MKIIKIDAEQHVSVIATDESGTSLDDMQKLIGGYIEHVLPRRLPAPYCMIVDEKGLLKGLPVNKFGSYLYQTDLHGCPIVGTVLLMKEKGENIIGLIDDDVKFLFKIFPQLRTEG